jgi:hypothetical protein
MIRKAFLISIVLIYITESAQLTDALKIPLSITVSGGVSQGSYQAGFLYFATEWLKNKDRSSVVIQKRGSRRTVKIYEPRIVTGSSAGGINALVTVLTLGSKDFPEPHKCPFYQIWIPVGFKELFNRDGVRAPGVFKHGALHAVSGDLLDNLMTRRRDPDRDCDMMLGLSATRLEPRTADRKGRQFPVQKERFVIRFSKHGKGIWIIDNYMNEKSPVEVPLLEFKRGGGKSSLKSLLDLLFASSCFPYVSAPRELNIIVADTLKDDTTGNFTWARARTGGYKPEKVKFIDGGVFDNDPLRLACSMAGTGLFMDRAAKSLAWRSMPDSVGRVHNDIEFLYLDPDNRTYPKNNLENRAPDVIKDAGLAPVPNGTARNFITIALANELYGLVDDNPGIGRQIRLTSSHTPLASSKIVNLFGFLEKDFRVFDFYVGMDDACRYIDSVTREGLSKNKGSTDFLRDRKFEWISGVLQGRDVENETALLKENPNLAILLQISLDKLLLCELPDAVLGTDSKQRDTAWAQRRHVLGPKQASVSRKKAENCYKQGDLELTLYLLEKYGFRFYDMGKGLSLNTYEIKNEIRKRMNDMLRGL